MKTQIQILSATPHHHSTKEIEAWFGEPVEIVSLSNSKRYSPNMTREYILRVTTEIHEGFDRFRHMDKVYFLVTGHPYFNLVAYDLLRHKLKWPFILLVYGADGYEVFATSFVSDLLSRG